MGIREKRKEEKLKRCLEESEVILGGKGEGERNENQVKTGKN